MKSGIVALIIVILIKKGKNQVAENFPDDPACNNYVCCFIEGRNRLVHGDIPTANWKIHFYKRAVLHTQRRTLTL